MKTTIFILTGIPGTGKTTILKEAVGTASNLTIVNYGDEMLNIAAGQKIDRDSMRRLPIPEQQAIGLLAAQKIMGSAKGITIVDTHALIQTPFGYVAGFPQKILTVLNPSAIILIESNPQVLYERRYKDKTRSRDADSIEKIEMHQSLSRSFATACSAMIGAVLIPISNDKEPSIAAKHLLEAIKFFTV